MRSVRRLCPVLLCLAASPVRAEPPDRSPAHGRQARLAPVEKGHAPHAPARREATAEREATDPDDPHERRIAKLRERLDEVLKEAPLSRTKVGVQVMQASDGDVLFSHNASVAFNPASNTKMLTTAAALARLGGDYRYHTALYGVAPDSDGVVRGDVILRGSGDPSLTASDLAEIASAAAARGVTRIEGSLIVDQRYHSLPSASASDAGDKESALILNRNVYVVRVRPSEPKHVAQVTVDPPIGYFSIENSVVTVAGKRSRLKVDSRIAGNHLVVTVKGKVADGRDYSTARRLADGGMVAGWTLKDQLGVFGVEVTGAVQRGTPAALPPLLAEHLSPPLADVCRLSNKPSNNFVAEAIYKTLGGELYGFPGTLQKGTRAVAEYLGSLGIAPGRFRIINGSGLTHENRITATDLSTMLRKVYFDLSTAPDFMSSLAVAGIDGTIRNRFAGTDAVGLVRAKTGTLSGVSALSGYVGDKSDVLIFSIFVEGFRHKKTNQVRHAQVRLVEAMLHYLRADAPSPNGERSGVIEPDEDTIDYESDGDPDIPEGH
jgi:D-alanyl-D-alanine carboxypeptidase/D-alanyl-D-alanine-endopeptidase (penicillin-binding protein 4)